MSEIIGNLEFRDAFSESRFGNPLEIEKMLKECEIVSVLPIDAFLSGEVIAKTNQVDIAHMQVEQESIRKAFSSNVALMSLVDTKDGLVAAVLKPEAGESQTRKNEFSIAKFWTREVDGYLVDKALGFDVIPPTTERVVELEGQRTIGSLQLFVPRSYAIPYSQASSEIKQQIGGSLDWMKIAILDYLINNADRKDDNMLVSTDGQALFAIDHGCSFCRIKETDILGPRKALLGQPIPQNLQLHLETFLNEADRLEQCLHEDVSFRMTLSDENIRAKTEQMLTKGVFL